ncbi:hypothetical protein [Microbulbifer yueqingensis]|uniref:Lipoprotein n=1 Tax=Microbulbifer yueqingensis TaxID=658219 RepID=A0A1G9CQ34_9GAMM|nr:hypothetical protein [Microbulbifer yueqingensis]SDK53762.1 hypothetical protein SAMN05216212_2587 [Microbulbifer yueqingensis]
MRCLKILAVAALLAFAGCSERVCFERGKPPSLPFPHAGVAVS